MNPSLTEASDLAEFRAFVLRHTCPPRDGDLDDREWWSVISNHPTFSALQEPAGVGEEARARLQELATRGIEQDWTDGVITLKGVVVRRETLRQVLAPRPSPLNGEEVARIIDECITVERRDDITTGVRVNIIHGAGEAADAIIALAQGEGE